MDESVSPLVEQVKKLYTNDLMMANVTARWEKTGLLNGLEPYVASQMALIMENQRIVKELVVPPKDNSFEQEMFLKHQILAVRRIYDPRFFVGFNLVSVQTLRGPADKLHYYNLIDAN
jgi:hypothetical protein